MDAALPPDSLALRVRASAVLLIFGLGWILLVGRAGYLTIGPDERLSDRLSVQQERVVSVAPRRGNIVDRLGRPLAVSIELDSVFADPKLVEDPVSASHLLAPLLGLESGALEAKLARTNTRFVWLARQVPAQVAEAVRNMDIPGVRLTAEPHRQYPSGSLASQLLGFVGTDGGGLEGLESKYDSVLMGDHVEYRVLRDGRRRPVNHEGVLSRRSTEGDTLVLTLDHSIQYRTELALSRAVEKRKARSGWATIMDVETGAVLAMASVPSFDSNHFRGVDPSRFRHRALEEVFEPGSTVKPFVVAEVLERGLATPETEIYCENGAYRVGKRTVHDTHEYDKLSVEDVIKFSSNIGTTKLAELLGPAGLEEVYRRFGFGRKSGVGMREERGILHPSSTWSRIGFATHSFGQGMAITAIQLTTAYASLLNGGRAVSPYIVAEIRGTDGKVIEDRRPLGEGAQLVSEATSREVTRQLGRVVEKGGTGTMAALDEYSSGGKTGTAQKVKDGRYARGAYVSSFVGFAPLENPRLVAFVVLDEPQGQYYGGTVAGPLFKELMTHSLRELGVAPDRGVQNSLLAQTPENETVESQQAKDVLDVLAEAGAGWKMPDLRGRPLREVIRILGPSGVDLNLEGSGLVQEQVPAPGESLKPDSEVTLALAMRDRPGKKRR